MKKAPQSSREVAPDPAVETLTEEEKARKLDAERASGRERAAKSYANRKASKKGSPAKKKAAPASAGAPSSAAAAGGDGPLGKVLEDEGAGAGEPRTPEEEAFRQAMEQFGTPEKFAGFMARMQKLAEVAARKSPRSQRVVQALEWSNEDGTPTDTCMMGVQLAWPWLEAGGLDFLAMFGPSFMAVLGAGLLFGPAIIVALDEYEEHKFERARRVNEEKKDKPPEKPAGQQVVNLREPKAEGA